MKLESYIDFNSRLNRKWLLPIANVTFLGFYIFLLWNSRIAHDDFYFLNNLEFKNILRATIDEYNLTSARYSGVFLCHSALFYFGIYKSIFAIGVLNIILFHLGFHLILKGLKRYNLLIGSSNFELFNLSLFIVLGLFYSTIKISENWFWLCASCNYTTSLAFMLIGIGSILQKSNKWHLHILIAISFAYVGGASGPLALIYIFMALFFMVWDRFINKKQNFKRIRSKLFFSVLITAVCFAILYFGPGNRARESMFEQISIFEAFVLNFKTTGMIVLLRLPEKIPFIIVFSIGIGFSFKEGNISYGKKKLIRSLLILASLLIIVFFTYQLPVTYKTQDIAAYRALMFVSLIVLVYGCASVYFLFNSFLFKRNLVNILASIAIVSVISVNIYNLYTQFNPIRNYSSAYDKRIEYLEAHKNCSKETLLLKPLPKVDFLFSAEICKSSRHFTNQHLRMGLNVAPQIAIDSSWNEKN